MYKPCYDADACALYFADDVREAPAALGGGRNVFVCGALQDPARMAEVLGHPAPFAPAVARGFRRVREVRGGAPAALMAPDAAEPERPLLGVIWLDLEEEDLERIDRLELEGGDRRRAKIAVLAGERLLTAVTYVKKSGSVEQAGGEAKAADRAGAGEST